MTEQTLSRYLQARKGDVAAAAKILHSTLVWRKGMHLGAQLQPSTPFAECLTLLAHLHFAPDEVLTLWP